MMDDESMQDDRIFGTIIAQMHSSDEANILRAVKAVRNILCRCEDPPINPLIHHGIVPICVRLLDSQMEELQVEAAWVLTNIAAGTTEQTMTVVKANAVPKFVHLLQSDKVVVSDHAVWALGNIAGDSPITRDIVLMYGAAEAILNLLCQERTIRALHNIVWLMSNLCRSSHSAKVELLMPALSYLLHHDDSAILSKVTWAIAYYTADYNGGTRLNSAIEAGCMPNLVRLLSHDKHEVVLPALQSIGNIAAGTFDQTNAVLAAGVLNYMKTFLNDSNVGIVARATRILSNITAGDSRQIQAVIDAGLFDDIRNVLMYGDIQAKKEAAYVITNASCGATRTQIQYLFRCGIFGAFSDLSLQNDASIDAIVVKGLQECFKVTATNLSTSRPEDCGAMDLMDKLNQLHLN